MELHPHYAEIVNHYLALLTLIDGVVIIIFSLYVGYLLFFKKTSSFVEMIQKWVLPLGFFISSAGLVLSMYYSEVLKYEPCELCWYQRIFLYPQVFLFAYAWYKKDKGILPYALILSVIGFVIGVYHHMLQMGYDLMKPCSDAPFAVSCSAPSFIEYGFVTFPLMAVVMFGSLIIISVVGVRFKK